MLALIIVTAVTCSAQDDALIESALARTLAGFEAAAIDGLPSASTCPDVLLARAALDAWHRARSVAPRGGAVELLPPVLASLQVLEGLRAPERALEVDYAATLVRAAIAAAQDERGELELLLTHARDLAERLARRGRAAVWPRSFNLAAGQLWFEVDRFADARAAFVRAAQSVPSSIALAGIARASVRLGDRPAACRAYEQMRDMAPPLERERAEFLRGCR